MKKRKRILPKPKSRLKSKRSSWRTLRLSYQLKRKFQILVLSLVVVISTVIVFGIIYLWQVIKTPFAEAAGSSNHNPTFQEDKRYNLCLILLEDKNNPVSHIKALSLASLNPIEASLSVVSIPVKATVQAAGGYGSHKISSLYALGEVAEPKMNVDMVTRSISKTLAVPIDAYILIDSRGLEELFDEMGQSFTHDEIDTLFTVRYLPKALTLLQLGRKNLRTNLDLYKILKILKFMFKVRSDKIATLNLTVGDLKDSKILDETILGLILDPKIANERFKVQVLNGTLVDGLGYRAARVVGNLGGLVLDVGNAENSDQKSTILISNESNSYTVRRLKEVFKISEVRNPVEGVGERADITLILGLDISDRL